MPAAPAHNSSCNVCVRTREISGESLDVDVTQNDGWFCQVQGASVAYFQVRAAQLGSLSGAVDLYCRLRVNALCCVQLATVFCLTAVSQSVYRFVCLRQTGTTIKLTLAEETAIVDAEEKALAEGLAAPSPPKEVNVLKLYVGVCFGVPTVLVAGMLAGQVPSATFSFQQMHNTGWCTINMDAPMRSFFLFYLPLVGCMFYIAGAYYFCFTEVKVKQGLLGKIDNEIMYDASAALVKKKTENEFDRARRATSVVRLSLLAVSICWTPQCLFGVLLVASSHGVVGGDPESLLWLTKVRSFTAIINPAFGVALFIVIESCFNFRLRYSQAFHQKMRRLRYKMCGKKKKKGRYHHGLESDRVDEDIGIFARTLTTLQNILWQTIELIAFSPWALVVWVPMDTFRSEVKSNKKLAYISVMYLVFIALPSATMFVLLPNFYAVVDATLMAQEVTDGDPKQKFSAGVAVLYIIYLILIAFIAWLHIGHKRMSDCSDVVHQLAFYLAVALVPVAGMAFAFEHVWQFIEDTEKSEADAISIKHNISVTFVYAYLGVMFSIVAGTLYISRGKTELNFIEHPVSHASVNTQNLRKLISQVLEGIQLTSLLLSHSAFSSDEVILPGNHPDDLLSLNSSFSNYNETGEPSVTAAERAAAQAAATLAAVQADDFAVDFAVMKIFMFDLSYFKALFEAVADIAFDLKLAMAVAAVCFWVVIVMVPIVLDTITLVQSELFSKIYGKIDFVQEFLAGPLFLIVLQSFLATVDCTKGEDGTMVLELKPSQVCWETNHLLYASAGLTGLMAFVPLAALTMVEHENAAMHFRYTPLYHRIEVIVKALMALITQFSNTMSPMYSFPLLMLMSLWMIISNQAMMPCCIIWANRIKTLGFMCQFWTGFAGIIAYYFWEPEILELGGVPLTPVSLMMVGWFCIVFDQTQKMKQDKAMLVKPAKKNQDGPAKAWSDYFNDTMTSRDKLQIKKLNSLRLAKRPDDTKIRYNTHHEILVMIYILRADASAATKQRALQILSAATGSTSAEAHTLVKQANEAASNIPAVNDAVEVDDNTSGTEVSLEPDPELTISVQTRRRLLGFQGDEHDEDEEDYHFPEVVLVSPRSIISLLAEEFHLTRERDKSSEQKYAEMWMVKKEDAEQVAQQTDGKKKKKKNKKNLTPEEREAAKLAKEAEKVAEKERKEADKTAKKELKKLKKDGVLQEDDNLTDVPLKTAELLFLLKRAKKLISEDVVESFGNELPKQFVVNTMLSYIRHHPPDVLRLQVSGAGATTMGVDKTGRPEFHDDHLLEHVLELPEDRIHHANNEDEEESLRKIRMIRRMYASSHVHQILERIETLPDETLERTDDAFDAQLDGTDATESDRQHHELLQRIHRLEQEKQIIDNEINSEKDRAMSNVSKVYLIRIIAIYAEDRTFAQRIIAEIGPAAMIDYLMHGDQQLQAAATVCMYQLSRFDPDCLDTLEHTPGGMVFVATKLTHPERHSVVMHRIAADLLVELAKRFELRRSMVASGLIGPLLLLVDAYAQLLMPGKNEVGDKLRKKVEDAVVTFTPRHVQVSEDGSLVDKGGKDTHAFTKSDIVHVDTNELEPWCPFSLKGVQHHSTHILLSIMRVFQQLSDEDNFRSEFVGRHKGLAWVKQHIYTIETDDAKVMAMRLLLGVVVPPFGFWDILQDAKMFTYYIELMKFKEADSVWQVELEPILKPDEWTVVEEGAQLALRTAREAGTKVISVEMRGQDFDVDMKNFKRTLPSTGRVQRMRIRPMVMHSRDMVLRMRMHRVAQFLDLKHRNESKELTNGHKQRLVIVEKMSHEEAAHHAMAHDTHLLEVVRERVLDECFDIVSEASLNTDEAVRIAGISVLVSVCSTVMHLEESMYERVFEHMHKVRKQCIEAKDLVMYESVVESMVALCRNHRKGQVVDRLHTAAEVFEQLWMYKHMLEKDLVETVKSPFWRRVAPVLTEDVLQIVSEVPNTSQMHYQALEKFVKHPDVEAFFTQKETDKRDAKRAQEEVAPEGHYVVELKPTTRDKIDRGVRKATEFARKLALHKTKSKSDRKRQRKADKSYNKLLSKQIADREEAAAEHEDVIKFLDNQVEADIEQMETGLTPSAESSTKPDIKFGNPLADEDFDSTSAPGPTISPRAPSFVANGFEDKRKEVNQAKQEKKTTTTKKKRKKNRKSGKEAEKEAASEVGSDSDDENGLDFKHALPLFVRLEVEQQTRDAGAEEDTGEINQVFVGGYWQGDLFNGCPCYVRSAMRTVQTPLGEIQTTKTMHVSVIRGTTTDRWFLCSDKDRLDDTSAHEAFLTTPKGELPLGTFQWRLGGEPNGIDEVTITLKACVSFNASQLLCTRSPMLKSHLNQSYAHLRTLCTRRIQTRRPGF
eukprot:COSAG02_NODE_404_length_23022_cov_305.366008_7_plen_2369_part_00